MIPSYSATAEQIYYPYPAPYAGLLDAIAAAPRLLLMVFRQLPPSCRACQRQPKFRGWPAASKSRCGLQTVSGIHVVKTGRRPVRGCGLGGAYTPLAHSIPANCCGRSSLQM